MIEAIVSYAFMQRAILAAILASILSGLIGVVIVEKRLVSMSGGIAHTSFGGIGLGYLLKLPPIVTGMLFAVTASLSLPVIKRKTQTAADTLIGMFWATGMALGILFIGLTPGYPPDMTSYLFGDILTVSNLYLMLLAILAVVVLFVFISMFNYWKAYLFDEKYLHVIGIKTQFFERILYVMIAMAIVLLIKVVGIILAIAMLTVPSAIAKLYTKSLKVQMISAAIVSLVTSLGGLTVSYYFNIPSGATIILLTVLLYGVAYWTRKLRT